MFYSKPGKVTASKPLAGGIHSADSEGEKTKAMSLDPDDATGANQYDLQNDVLLTVFQIREIIILFTFSPVKNSLLQQEWGKNF